MNWNLKKKKKTKRILEGKLVLENRKHSTTRPRTCYSGTEENEKTEAEGKSPCFIFGYKCKNNKTKCELKHFATFKSSFPFKMRSQFHRLIALSLFDSNFLLPTSSRYALSLSIPLGNKID